MRFKKDFHFCDLRNVSVCADTQSVGMGKDKVCFAVWNGLAHSRVELLELPVSLSKVQVVSTGGQAVPLQLSQALPSLTNYGQPAGGANLTLLAELRLPALGYGGYCLQLAGSEPPQAKLVDVQAARRSLERHLESA